MLPQNRQAYRLFEDAISEMQFEVDTALRLGECIREECTHDLGDRSRIEVVGLCAEDGGEVLGELGGDSAWTRRVFGRERVEIRDWLANWLPVDEFHIEQACMGISPADGEDVQRFALMIVHDVVEGARLGGGDAHDTSALCGACVLGRRD